MHAGRGVGELTSGAVARMVSLHGDPLPDFDLRTRRVLLHRRHRSLERRQRLLSSGGRVLVERRGGPQNRRNVCNGERGTGTRSHLPRESHDAVTICERGYVK